MTEAERKIQQWRHERLNKKGFKSQVEYDETARKTAAIRDNAVAGLYPNATAIALELEVRVGFGPQRAKELANKWLSTSQRT